MNTLEEGPVKGRESPLLFVRSSGQIFMFPSLFLFLGRELLLSAQAKGVGAQCTTTPITFNLPRRHSVFGPLQCWPGRRRVFRRDQKSNCEEDALLLVSALVTRGRRYFVRKVCFFSTHPPRPPSLNVECRSFSIRSTNYFGHGGRRSCPTLREGGRGGRPTNCVLAS